MAEENELDFPVGESMQAFTDAVRRTAYFLWEQAGRPAGEADKYWYQALDQHVRARYSDDALRHNAPKR